MRGPEGRAKERRVPRPRVQFRNFWSIVEGLVWDSRGSLVGQARVLGEEAAG